MTHIKRRLLINNEYNKRTSKYYHQPQSHVYRYTDVRFMDVTSASGKCLANPLIRRTDNLGSVENGEVCVSPRRPLVPLIGVIISFEWPSKWDTEGSPIDMVKYPDIVMVLRLRVVGSNWSSHRAIRYLFTCATHQIY